MKIGFTKSSSTKFGMMTFGLMICIFMATAAAMAQTSQPPTLKTPAERGQAPSLQTRDGHGVVPADAPIITIQGLCPAVTTPADIASVPSVNECVTKMTNEQFTALMKAFNGNRQTPTLAEQRKLQVDYIPTHDMVADGMTKPLQKPGFMRFKELLGVVE